MPHLPDVSLAKRPDLASGSAQGADASVASKHGSTRRVALLWWLASFLLLFALFASGVLRSSALPRIVGAYPTAVVNKAPHFDRVSEVLVENAIDRRFAGLEAVANGFMFHVPHRDPRVLAIDDPNGYLPDWNPGLRELANPSYYRSQIGLQGRVWAALSDRIGLERAATLRLLRALSAAALAAMLAGLIAFVAVTWGSAPAAAALAFCALATGFNLFATRLYWVSFLHVAPTVVTALLAFNLARWRWSVRVAAFALVGVLFMAKFACGYEFMTVTISAAVIPFVIAFASQRLPLKTSLALSAAVLATGLAAFVLTLALYDAMHVQAFGESGLAYLRHRSGGWSGPPLIGPLGGPVHIGKVLMINTVDAAGYGLPGLIFFAAAIPFVVIAIRGLLHRRLEDERVRVAICVSAALLASCSWLLLQFPHIAFHARYASILVAFPFGIVLVAAYARLWQLRRGTASR